MAEQPDIEIFALSEQDWLEKIARLERLERRILGRDPQVDDENWADYPFPARAVGNIAAGAMGVIQRIVNGNTTNNPIWGDSLSITNELAYNFGDAIQSGTRFLVGREPSQGTLIIFPYGASGTGTGTGGESDSCDPCAHLAITQQIADAADVLDESPAGGDTIEDQLADLAERCDCCPCFVGDELVLTFENWIDHNAGGIFAVIWLFTQLNGKQVAFSKEPNLTGYTGTVGSCCFMPKDDIERDNLEHQVSILGVPTTSFYLLHNLATADCSNFCIGANGINMGSPRPNPGLGMGWGGGIYLLFGEGPGGQQIGVYTNATTSCGGLRGRHDVFIPDPLSLDPGNPAPLKIGEIVIS